MLANNTAVPCSALCFTFIRAARRPMWIRSPVADQRCGSLSLRASCEIEGEGEVESESEIESEIEIESV